MKGYLSVGFWIHFALRPWPPSLGSYLPWARFGWCRPQYRHSSSIRNLGQVMHHDLKGEDWNHGGLYIMFDSMFNIVSIIFNFRFIIRSDWLHGWVDSRIKNQWWTKRARHGNMLRSLRPIHRNFWESNPQKARWEDLIFSMIHPWIMISGWIKWYANTGPNPSMLSRTNPLQICRLVNHYILKLGTWWDFFCLEI